MFTANQYTSIHKVMFSSLIIYESKTEINELEEYYFFVFL
jgi:hypothetical protein